MTSRDGLSITRTSDGFVTVSPENAAYTQFLLDLKVTGTLAGEVAYFVAQDGAGRRVGRMAATLGPTADVGLVGLLAMTDRRSDSVFGALLSECERWLMSRGVDKVYGPVDFSTFFEYRMRDRAEERGPEADFSWEPAQPRGWLLAFEAAGYAPVERYHSEFYEATEACPLRAVVESLAPAWRAATDRGMEFVPFSEVRPVDRLLPIIEAITFDAFEGNFLYSPIPAGVFRTVYSPMVGRHDLSLSQLVRTPDGEEVGFLYAFEDAGYCVIKSMAVRPAWRRLRLSNALLQRCLTRVDEKGLTRFASAFVREGNVSGFLEDRLHEHPLRTWKHHYVLLGKTLKGADRWKSTSS
jgi:N-acetylglutamate synthase-like GNAT family acetyltransferase